MHTLEYMPCVKLRDNTELSETLEVRSNVLAGTNPDVVVEQTRSMIKNNCGWGNPFGDGKTGGENSSKIEGNLFCLSFKNYLRASNKPIERLIRKRRKKL